MGFLDQLFGLGRPMENEDEPELGPRRLSPQLYELLLKNFMVSFLIHVQRAEEAIETATVKHAATLRRKRKELISCDDYGEPLTEAWHQEIAYFVRRCAGFADSLKSVEEWIEEERAIGNLGDETYDDQLRYFAEELPVATVEAALGLRPRRKRGKLDQEADSSRLAGKFMFEEMMRNLNKDSGR